MNTLVQLFYLLDDYMLLLDECLLYVKLLLLDDSLSHPSQLLLHAFLYKNVLHKNVEDEIGQKIKNIRRICSP